MTSKPAEVTLPTDEQILITREFDASPHLVYRAWTEPELVRRWWATRGDMTVCDIDLRVGGKWRYVMVTQGGMEVAFNGEYREIVPGERLVFTEMYEAPGMEELDVPVNTVSFTEVDGRTRLELLTQTSSKELRDMILESGMEDGVQEQMELLDELFAELR